MSSSLGFASLEAQLPGLQLPALPHAGRHSMGLMLGFGVAFSPMLGLTPGVPQLDVTVSQPRSSNCSAGRVAAASGRHARRAAQGGFEHRALGQSPGVPGSQGAVLAAGQRCVPACRGASRTAAACRLAQTRAAPCSAEEPWQAVLHSLP